MTRFGVTAVALAITGALAAAVALASDGTERTTPVGRCRFSDGEAHRPLSWSDSASPLDTSERRRRIQSCAPSRAGRIGGVILFTNNMPTPAVARRAINKLQAWAKAGGMPPLFVMIDQEGGIVQRLPTLPPTRTPASMGRSSDPARTGKSQGLATGRALKKYGFNVNLAPVVDVPKVKNSFLGNRAYSSSAQIVADATCAFAEREREGRRGRDLQALPGTRPRWRRHGLQRRRHQRVAHADRRRDNGRTDSVPRRPPS